MSKEVTIIGVYTKHDKTATVTFSWGEEGEQDSAYLQGTENIDSVISDLSSGFYYIELPNIKELLLTLDNNPRKYNEKKSRDIWNDLIALGYRRIHYRGDKGTKGQIKSLSDGLMYVCVESNTWVRIQ
jgi:hypothetical protein